MFSFDDERLITLTCRGRAWWRRADRLLWRTHRIAGVVRKSGNKLGLKPSDEYGGSGVDARLGDG